MSFTSLRSRPRDSVFAFALALGLAPFNVEAQELSERDDEDEIVVLGTRDTVDRALSSDRVTERMSQSSRSIKRDILVAAGTYRLSDALELVSGFSQQNNRGGVIDNFAVRGFLGTPDGGAEYYLNGFLGNRGMAPPRDPATTERIEVLKGPAGALFGDVDPGGRVNIVTTLASSANTTRRLIAAFRQSTAMPTRCRVRITTANLRTALPNTTGPAPGDRSGRTRRELDAERRCGLADGHAERPVRRPVAHRW
jgi:outer membrane receptor protein involved in Fe transport